MAVLPPDAIVRNFAAVGEKKANYALAKTLALGFLAGVFIAFGGILSQLVAGGTPALKSGMPGLQRFLCGAIFPVGLILVVFTASELFTGNTAVLIPALLEKKTTWNKLLRNWFIVYAANFIGAFFAAYFFAKITGIFASEPWLSYVKNLAVAKTVQGFWPLFWRGIAANWLVCLAVWLATSTDEAMGKILGIWFPIMAFVTLGLEHSIANMYFIPVGMLHGAKVSLAMFLVNNLVPVTLGNIIGGSVFVGLLPWFAFPSQTSS